MILDSLRTANAKGYASDIVERIAQDFSPIRARARGITKLSVPSSMTAEHFYTKLGFAAVRDSYHGVERTIIMECRL